MPGTLLSVGDIPVDRTGNLSALLKFMFQSEKIDNNKEDENVKYIAFRKR